MSDSVAAHDRIASVGVGDALPPLVLDVSATMIVRTAVASRDFEPVHHDRTAAQASGLPDVILNILSSNGLAVRLVTDWAGPHAVVRRSRIRLGVPHCAGEQLTLAGEVAALERHDDAGVVVDVAVTGTNQRGTHLRGTVTVALPARAAP